MTKKPKDKVVSWPTRIGQWHCEHWMRVVEAKYSAFYEGIFIVIDGEYHNRLGHEHFFGKTKFIFCPPYTFTKEPIDEEEDSSSHEARERAVSATESDRTRRLLLDAGATLRPKWEGMDFMAGRGALYVEWETDDLRV